jgi:excisionase family DNA binding protein
MAKEKKEKGPLLRVGAVASRLALSKAQVYVLAEVGALSSVKIGGALRFDAEDLERFIEGCKRGRRGTAA